MSATSKRQFAEQAYRNGEALVRERRFTEAISELRRAEELFRRLDARGHPFNFTLENGVSGLANSLFLLGVCHLEIGDIPSATTYFETSTVNEAFERTFPFRSFLKNVHDHLISCYDGTLARSGQRVIDALHRNEPSIDITYRFPFSLEPKSIPAARLYELAPERFPQFRSFYTSAREKDSVLRRAGSRTDDASMRAIALGVWSVLAAIWIAYGLAVVRALMLD